MVMAQFISHQLLMGIYIIIIIFCYDKQCCHEKSVCTYVIVTVGLAHSADILSP